MTNSDLLLHMMISIKNMDNVKMNKENLTVTVPTPEGDKTCSYADLKIEYLHRALAIEPELKVRGIPANKFLEIYINPLFKE